MIAARFVALAVVLCSASAFASSKHLSKKSLAKKSFAHKGRAKARSAKLVAHVAAKKPKRSVRPATRLARADVAPREDRRVAEAESAGSPGYAPRAPAADGLGLDDEGASRGSRVVRHSVVGETADDDRVIR